MTTLPNPFLQFAGCVEHTPADSAGASFAPASQVDAPASFSSPLEPAMAGESAAAPALADSRDAAADRFTLDVDAFMAEIEPPPLFLQAPLEALAILARRG